MRQEPIPQEIVCAALPEPWPPRVLGQLRHHCIKIIQVEDALPGHAHEAEDGIVRVLGRCLRIGSMPELVDPVDKQPGEFFALPDGTSSNRSRAKERWLRRDRFTSTLQPATDVLLQTPLLAGGFG